MYARGVLVAGRQPVVDRAAHEPLGWWGGTAGSGLLRENDTANNSSHTEGEGTGGNLSVPVTGGAGGAVPMAAIMAGGGSSSSWRDPNGAELLEVNPNGTTIAAAVVPWVCGGGDTSGQ